MAKQSTKQTLADKKTSKKDQPKAAAPVKVGNPNGPVPDFVKNVERENTRKQQEVAEREKTRLATFAEYVRKERLRLPKMLVGATGKYYVCGENSHGNFTGFDFVVKQHGLPSKDGKPGQDVLVIQEGAPQEGTVNPVFIFHNWLMKSPSKIKFAGGKIGDVQSVMLAFLQHNLAKEIVSLKAFRAEQYRLKQEAEKVSAPCVPVPVAGCDMTLMAGVDKEHELAEA